ncbi:MAG: 3-deoxy-manno-octulosonate cytidylyltransferase (CMP-KDO synthetase) [Nitrospirae bacterium]|nr:MAG: 3-deoxy-manno-octulosonate cytidylyltransferase (CMP-KDO synthetase) [Nitrospirota bacterium]
MPAIVVIPARFGASRFPGKPLASLAGKPMIQHVYENAARAKRAQAVFVATDSEQIAEAVRAFGGAAVMTSDAHQSGTDRIAEAVQTIMAGGMFLGIDDIIVNVQGDEPLLNPAMVDEVISVMKDPKAEIGTLVKRIDKAEDLFNPNVVKTVFSHDGYALYFSRAPIPYHRDLFARWGTTFSDEQLADVIMYKHYGIYAYRRGTLERFAKMLPTPLEQTEKLEQLRALEQNIAIKVGITDFNTIGVDTPEDLERVRQWLSISSSPAE